MPVSAGENRSGHIKEEVAMRYSSDQSNGADGCSVWSRSYQNASNRALHLPMRANQGLVPASASLRASKDVSPSARLCFIPWTELRAAFLGSGVLLCELSYWVALC